MLVMGGGAFSTPLVDFVDSTCDGKQRPYMDPMGFIMYVTVCLCKW